MLTHFRELSVKGKIVQVPAYLIDERLIVVTGTVLKIASFHDEEWIENLLLENPLQYVERVKHIPIRPDIFAFAQPFSEERWHLPYLSEEDDVAAVKLTTFAQWWESLPQESRKNVRKGEKRGVTTRLAVFDDQFVAGIKKLYDENPIRQGRRFWHYGKDLPTIKRENSSFLDRSDFIGAYFEGELIGFIKMVYVRKVARIMQILSMNAHMDKKTPNLLLSKAVEVCSQKGMTHFVYGKYFYGNKGMTPITEFKRRNGFERIIFPRYFVPLTLKGKTAMSANLHRGIQNLLPQRLTNALLEIRARVNRPKAPPATLENATEGSSKKPSR